MLIARTNWKLPAELRGGDDVQAVAADHAYSAVDLMELGVKGPTVVYVAHDDRSPRPGWLTKQSSPVRQADGSQTCDDPLPAAG